jgi:hypothetical protein
MCIVPKFVQIANHFHFLDPRVEIFKTRSYVDKFCETFFCIYYSCTFDGVLAAQGLCCACCAGCSSTFCTDGVVLAARAKLYLLRGRSYTYCAGEAILATPAKLYSLHGQQGTRNLDFCTCTFKFFVLILFRSFVLIACKEAHSHVCF